MPTERSTNFEKFWKEGMAHTEVLQHLHFHKSSGATSSGMGGAAPSGEDKLAKVRNQLQQMQEQMQGIKRKMGNGKGQRDWQGYAPKGEGKKGAKGVGGQKGAKGGKNTPPASGVPRDRNDCRQMRMSINGEKVCWDYHLPHGCSAAQLGQWCSNGWHLCHRCGKAHSLQVPCP